MTEDYITKTEILRYRPKLIISGFQSGTDFGGVLAAKALGIPTSGYIPKGFRTEYGNNPSLGPAFSAIEHPSRDYPPRTEDNVIWGDATLIIQLSSVPERGSKLTADLCTKYNKPKLIFTLPATSCDNAAYAQELYAWLYVHRPEVLNVAGNRESVSPGIEGWTRHLLLAALEFSCK